MPSYKWYYPDEIANDLKDVDLPQASKAEVFACAWEYSRCVIPTYTNWNRYIAFMRIIIIGTIAEFRGDLFDMTVDDNHMLGYSLDQVLEDLFVGTVGAEDMAREYRTFLTVTSNKTSERSQDEFFQRYRRALASSPQSWFRLRDCDALCRFTIAAALACNDMNDVWFTDEQFDVLAEIGDTLYDSIAFYKHRAEGETNNTFAYMPEDLRVEAFRNAREILWAIDVASVQKPEWPIVVNFLRFFGGPIHMMMRRYRFVEEGLVIGKAEDDDVVQAARKHEKLWHRLDLDESRVCGGRANYELIIAKQERLLFRGFMDIMMAKKHNDSAVPAHATSPGEKHFDAALGSDSSCEEWESFALGLADRVRRAFPHVDRGTALLLEISGSSSADDDVLCHVR